MRRATTAGTTLPSTWCAPALTSTLRDLTTTCRYTTLPSTDSRKVSFPSVVLAILLLLMSIYIKQQHVKITLRLAEQT